MSAEIMVIENAELLSPWQTLFYEGRELGARFEADLTDCKNRFLQEAKPFVEKVMQLRPWESPEFKEFNHPDPQRALKKFVQAAFRDPEKSNVNAMQHANVALMVIKRNIP